MNQESTDFYKLLGVKRDASVDEIKKNYKKMAMKYHPDKNNTPEAEEIFKKINYAHKVLTDPKKRQLYDELGEEGLKENANETGFDPFDIFGNLGRKNKRPLVQMKHIITLEEYFTKKYTSVSISRNVKCDLCNGTCFSDCQFHPCIQCNGSGLIVQTICRGPIFQQRQIMCNICKGKRIDIRCKIPRCSTCDATGIITKEEKLDVEIPTDIVKKPTTTIFEKGPWVDDKYADLEIIFKLKMPKNFGLSSDRKLVYTMHINYTETICGFKRVIDHPSGKKVLVVSERGYIINPDNIYSLDNLGFDEDLMYLIFVVHYPENITLRKRQLTFESLELSLGPRYSPDEEIDTPHIYILSKLNKINNNPRSKENNEESEDDDNNADVPEFKDHSDAQYVQQNCTHQ